MESLPLMWHIYSLCCNCNVIIITIITVINIVSIIIISIIAIITVVFIVIIIIIIIITVYIIIINTIIFIIIAIISLDVQVKLSMLKLSRLTHTRNAPTERPKSFLNRYENNCNRQLKTSKLKVHINAWKKTNSIPTQEILISATLFFFF